MHSSQSPPSQSASYAIEFSLPEVTFIYAEMFLKLRRDRLSEEDQTILQALIDKLRRTIGNPQPKLDTHVLLREENQQLKARLHTLQVALDQLFQEYELSDYRLRH